MELGIGLIVAFVGFLGSSAVAAWLQSASERRWKTLEGMDAAYRDVAKAQQELVHSLGEYSSILQVYERQGRRLWTYQKPKIVAALADAKASLMNLGTARMLFIAVHPDAEQAANALGAAATAALRSADAPRMAAIANNEEKCGVELKFDSGGSEEVVAAIDAALEALRTAAASVFSAYAHERRQLVEAPLVSRRSFAWSGVVTLATVVLAVWLVTLSAWSYIIQDGSVIWANRMTRVVERRALPEPPGAASSAAAAAPDERTGSPATRP